MSNGPSPHPLEPLDPNALKHLDMIERVIERMARNSFSLKAWTVVLVSALFALAADRVDGRLFLVGLLPVFVFWALDGYFLWQERLFRALYDAVRNRIHDASVHGPFSMNTRPYLNAVAPWHIVCVSLTLRLFYGCLLVAVVAVASVVITVDA